MLRKLVLFSAMLIVASTAIAQYPKKKPARIWYKLAKKETFNYDLEAKDIVSEALFTKFKLAVKNKTVSYILIKPQECIFKSGIVELNPIDKKTLKISPFETEARVFDVKNTSGSSLYDYPLTFTIGGIYKAGMPTDVKPDALSIPPTQNVIEIGGFRIELVQYDVSVESKNSAKFRVTYLGEGIGIVDSKKISAQTKSGTILANTVIGKKFALESGESEGFYTYFDKNEPVTIIWNDAFKTALLEKLDPQIFDFEFDPKRK